MKYKNKKRILFHNFYSDIRFWIVIFFIIRMYGITNPPLEVAHNWRQTTVAMVARNFYEKDANLFYPRVDFAGEKSGITGMEFPLFNYLIYLFSRIFGYSHWYGRLINLIISSIGIYYFYLIILKYFKKQHAFYSTIILLGSLWFAYSRKIMPDTFSISLLLIGIFYGLKYLDASNNPLHLLFFCISTLLGMLSKLPSGYLLVLFIPILFNRHVKKLSKILFCSTIVIICIVCYLWYFYWVPYLVEEYGFWHFFMGKPIFIGLKELLNNFQETTHKFYFSAMKYSGFFLFVFGIILAFIKSGKKLLLIFAISSMAFIIVMFKAGFAFYHHNYYILPYIPIMSFFAGFFISNIKIEWVAIVITLIFILENILNQQHEFFIKENYMSFIELEEDLNKISGKDDLIAINSSYNPTPMYFAHRKGWIVSNKNLSEPEYIKTIESQGCKLIVICKSAFGQPVTLGYKKMIETEHYCIYEL